MCVDALYDLTPDQRESIALVESLRAMREAKHHWRAHYRSMPAVMAYTPARPPRVEAVTAGAYSIKEKAA